MPSRISGYTTDIAVEKARHPNEILTLQGVNHFDLHDNDAYLDPVTEKLDTFFAKALNL